MTGQEARERDLLRDAGRIASDQFGINGNASRLQGCEGHIFRIDGDDGSQWVLKLSPCGLADSIELQCAVLKFLASQNPGVAIQSVRSAPAAGLPKVEFDGEQWLAWVVSYLNGPVQALTPQSRRSPRELGSVMGRLDRSLSGFEDVRARRYLRWDIAQGKDLRAGLKAIDDPARRLLASDMLERSLTIVDRLNGDMRRSVIHGDANDYNLLTSNDGACISAVIDFGDLVESWRVAEAAIAAAYALLDTDGPVTPAVEVLAGYHSEWPLNAAEIEAFLPLVEIRLCMTVIHAAMAADEGNGYAQTHAEAVWNALAALEDRNFRRGHYLCRAACGLDSTPQTRSLTQWLAKRTADFSRVIPDDLLSSAMLLDLSVGSDEVSAPSDDVETMTEKLFAHIESAGSAAGIGRYRENRSLYQSELFSAGRTEARSFHLGLDLFAVADTPVMAPMDGQVLSVADNARDLDYGPTVILQHDADGQRFFTLYGHLSTATLDHLKPGQDVGSGDVIGWIGTYPRNGNWPPHLHFQIMTDMLDYQGDFPGVASPSEAWYWRGLCLDPNLMLGLELPVDAAQDDPRPELAKRRDKILSNSLTLSYEKPLLITRGRGQFLYNYRNRAWLDLVNNVSHVGHCHPRVVDAVNRQMSLLNTNTRYLHPLIVEYAERITALLPDPLKVCFLVSSGSEANELAIRLARAATGRRNLLVLDHAYHGNTAGLVEMSPYKFNGPGGEGQAVHIDVLPLPDSFPQRSGALTEEATTAVLDSLKDEERLPAALFAETIPGCGGQRVLPDGFLANIYRRVRELGGICVADEVQTGLGRMGDCWWSFETQNLLPDIVTMGKPMGNGHPLAAVVTSEEIAAEFVSGMEYFNTFGGNPVSCAAGLAVLDIIENEGLRQNALDVGGRMKQGLQKLAGKFEVLADVRGHGLFLGVEVVKDRKDFQPDRQRTGEIVEAMLEYGVMLSIDGPGHNVLKIKPPMVVDRADADDFLGKLDRVLDQMA
ncbi:MAG: aminotransferase class III-fold pyridoxal phosphate-dependent enzyme [Gammaproteobacteria bacterium]|nr:aminotransferase class III-fold pyridoxal phosphate-dependent enzyme [Gammaproteobacteria bacterium]